MFTFLFISSSAFFSVPLSSSKKCLFNVLVIMQYSSQCRFDWISIGILSFLNNEFSILCCTKC